SRLGDGLEWRRDEPDRRTGGPLVPGRTAARHPIITTGPQAEFTIFAGSMQGKTGKSLDFPPGREPARLRGAFGAGSSDRSDRRLPREDAIPPPGGPPLTSVACVLQCVLSARLDGGHGLKDLAVGKPRNLSGL